ncbi:MAG TPA: FkbM family methyltransferase [Puia sp.]|nr:FkbM family methyltransferase [Puia sp.]
MKKRINSILHKFGFEVHGISYLQKMSKKDFQKDAFEVQYELLKKNAKIIFDVGANRGDVSEKYFQLFPSAKIYAFEPFPECFENLQQRFESIRNINCVQMAISSKKEAKDFFVNRSADTNSLYKSNSIGLSSDKLVENVSTIQVNCISIDEFCEENNIQNIDILKMDIQGGELNALKGAVKLLKDQRIKLIYSEVFFVEQYIAQPLFEDISFFLRDFGYHLQDFYDPFYGKGNIVWADTIFVRSDG